MLTLNVEGDEFFDSEKQMFFYTKPSLINLEHSLISVAKWEAHWKKPYLPSWSAPGMQGPVEELDYIRCMIIGKFEEHIPALIQQNHLAEVRAYMLDSHTASVSHRIGKSETSKKTVTSELIYFWMIKFGIPFECEKWHFNRLLSLIDVCNLKEAELSGKNKMSAQESAEWRNQLNKKRRGLA
jgi:hypothetical protein